MFIAFSLSNSLRLSKIGAARQFNILNASNVPRKPFKFVGVAKFPKRSLEMAWRCSADSNDGLVDNLKKNKIIRSERVEKAMRSVDRKNYVSNSPYTDSPQYIGYGATISAPHMHAIALENLEPFLKPGMKALDIGSGSGYLTVCMEEMVGPEGKVTGIEHIPQLVDMAKSNVQKDRPELLESKRVEFIVGDGREGYAGGAPYDCIHVGAAAGTTPQALIDQLKAPGRLFIPVGHDNENQTIYQYDKDVNGEVTKRSLMGVIYVPLTDARKQLNANFAALRRSSSMALRCVSSNAGQGRKGGAATMNTANKATVENKVNVTLDFCAAVSLGGLDPEILQMVPQPVKAVLILFPINDAHEQHSKEEAERIQEKGQEVSSEIVFYKQTISNACGTIGLLHSLANNLDSIKIDDGPLKQLLDKTRSGTPLERAKLLEEDGELAEAHKASALTGQSRPPSELDKVNTHFVCFIQKDGSLYELDGRKSSPINHGSCTDLLLDSAKIIKQFMDRVPGNLQFTMIALAPKQFD
ncbi:16732_t:CDS:2 [Acaulospora colombiana]|uniref:16732_t:CDS:1 n=1 Tax=Acaulospora colombiana TaxID=27376 RepID=A0ACA9L1E5_9GLOM|nr:16732_t:CDS:2 [Acaulospora colombiana]